MGKKPWTPTEKGGPAEKEKGPLKRGRESSWGRLSALRALSGGKREKFDLEQKGNRAARGGSAVSGESRFDWRHSQRHGLSRGVMQKTNRRSKWQGGEEKERSSRRGRGCANPWSREGFPRGRQTSAGAKKTWRGRGKITPKGKRGGGTPVKPVKKEKHGVYRGGRLTVPRGKKGRGRPAARPLLRLL